MAGRKAGSWIGYMGYDLSTFSTATKEKWREKTGGKRKDRLDTHGKFRLQKKSEPMMQIRTERDPFSNFPSFMACI